MATLGTLITTTTYGTWLRGDARGWVKDGTLMPAAPLLSLEDYARLHHPPFQFNPEQLLTVGQMICDSLRTRLQVRLLALTVQTSHIHFVFPATHIPMADIVKCAKDAVRYGLRPGRPIWTEGYDHRFCHDWQRLQERVKYVEEHNVRARWSCQPWQHLWTWEEYVRDYG